MDRVFAAHIKNENTIQTIKDHLIGTARRSKKFGDVFNSGDYTYLCGLLHDIGKYSDKFQKRIHFGGNMVDHSTAGAAEIKKLLPRIGVILSYCIAGHHTGLPDGGSIIDTSDEPTLYGRLKKDLEPYTSFEEDLKLLITSPNSRISIHPLGRYGFSLSFYIRMLFSCLVDADYLDTESFMTENVNRYVPVDMETLNTLLDSYIVKFNNPTTEINKKRTEILSCCIEKSNGQKGLYTLTVPTGGGKNISTLAFSLKHAKLHKMNRVIYVIPYNTIIEQNAAVFKEILGDQNVLEHHSGFNFDDANEQLRQQRLAAENWDMPVIVTTNVQFFESLFSNKTSACRKLHNIANSVIVFDEAQMLPTPYLIPCIRAISELVINYGCTVVLCSATQPALENLFPKEIKSKEIIENKKELYCFFRRTNISQISELNDNDLADKLRLEKQVLCIVNTRKQAKTVYDLIENPDSFHLSTLMYPKHRTQVIKEIKQRLINGVPCRVVSTSLIEAGVDIDFPVVYRAEAGIDSEIQAAGRCNREGKLEHGQVYIFTPQNEYRNRIPAMFKRPIEIAHSISNRYDDISSPEAISDYFASLYKIEGNNLDIKSIVNQFENGLEQGFSFPFAQVASEFKLIEDNTCSVIIPADIEAQGFISRLKSGERNRQLLRSVQQYIVNVYRPDYITLLNSRKIERLDDELAVLLNADDYNEKTGLVLFGE